LKLIFVADRYSGRVSSIKVFVLEEQSNERRILPPTPAIFDPDTPSEREVVAIASIADLFADTRRVVSCKLPEPMYFLAAAPFVVLLDILVAFYHIREMLQVSLFSDC
jgi:hypothetical protein